MSASDGRYAALLARIENAVVLGPELLRNPQFVNGAAGGWTAGAGWSAAGSVITAATVTTALSQTHAYIVTGRVYRVSYEIVTRTAGDVRFQFTGGSNDNGTVQSAVGRYSEDITITQTITSMRLINGGTAFAGTLCNLSVREVTRGL